MHPHTHAQTDLYSYVNSTDSLGTSRVSSLIYGKCINTESDFIYT